MGTAKQNTTIWLHEYFINQKKVGDSKTSDPF